ncbi:MAG: hypothetical protein IPH59_11245 [bacterium]|nr:hypothetical protein [bacterium]
MKLTARHLILLVLAGILVLSVPLMAGERTGAQPQVVQLQSLTDEAAPTFMESVMMAVKAQLRLWLSIDSTPVVKPEIKTTTTDQPEKGSRILTSGSRGWSCIWITAVTYRSEVNPSVRTAWVLTY